MEAKNVIISNPGGYRVSEVKPTAPPAAFGQTNMLADKSGAVWLTVVLFAIGMAWVESAVVYDLRTLVNRIEPYQPNPLPLIGGLGPVELVREAATLLMLLTVGMLAGRTWRHRVAYSAIAFGVWDIFYYIFLRVICGWPHSLLDWDILFLLPLPWWGPVLAPVLIATLMIAWGSLVTQFERTEAAAKSPLVLTGTWLLSLTGALLALYTFMADCLKVARGGTDAVRNVLPTHFNWVLFVPAFVCMAVPIASLAWQIRGGEHTRVNQGAARPVQNGTT